MASLERDRVRSPGPIAAREVTLVDRTEEMNILKEAVYRAVHGEGGLVFLHGEAGIGKTRLIRELGAHARSHGVQVLHGRCPALFKMDGVPPYILWKEVIKDYLETCTPEQLYRVIGYYPAEVVKLVPELSQKLRAIPQSFPISPEQEQNRLFEAVSQFITNISREGPLLVVLDDLQWTDSSSLLLLHYLARDVQKTPLLLLGAYRSTDVDAKHPLTPILTELKRERLPQSVSLKRMSLEDNSQIIRQILEQDDISPEFCRTVYEKTRGNPFFTEEVIESLKEEKVIYREENKWKIKEVSRIEFPDTVKSVIKARIDRLNDEQQHVLTMASLVGNDFTFEVLQRVLGLDEDKLRKIVDGLLKTGLLKHTDVRGEDVCSFADIIVRDVMYEEVGPYERKKLHGIVGTALEKVCAGKIDEHFGELALHFLESGQKDKALNCFLKAGERAVKIYANSEATSHFESALKLLEEKEGELLEKGLILERLGDIKNLVGEYEDCLKYWDEALLLWDKLREKEKTATLHRKMASVLWGKIGNTKKAEEHHKAALNILETEPKSVELARLYEDVAHMHRRTGEVAKALPWAQKALALAEELNALEAVAVSYIELAVLLVSMTGDFKKGLEYVNRALKIALDNNYLETALWAYNGVTQDLPLEEYEKRLEAFEKGLALAKKLGDASWQSQFLGWLANEYTNWGKLDKAIAFGEEALALAKKAWRTQVPVYLQNLGFAYQVMGEWDKSEQYYNKASSIAQNLNEFAPRALSYHYHGLLHFDKEEYVKAKECFEEELRIYEKAGDKTGAIACSQSLIWTLIELGGLEKAQNLLDSLQRFARETGDSLFNASEMALRSVLLRAQKKYEESIERFGKTLREWESLKANTWYAYYFAKLLLCEYARAHLERSEENDKEKAHRILNQALELFQKMGAKKDVEKVESKLIHIEGGQVVSEPTPTGEVATGYADLDRLLYGGLPPNYAVILTSPSCDERDLLIKSFLEAGAKKGEATFYMTTSPGMSKALAEEFPSSFCLFVCNPQADAIVKSQSNVFKLKGVENLTDISIALTSAIRELDPSLKSPRRICIGLISDILLQHRAVQTRKWLAALIPELKSEGFTTLAVMDPEMHSSQEVRAVLDLFGGEISIYEEQTEKGVGKFLKIKRLSDKEYLGDELPLTRKGFKK